jgi:hypothetical protein
MYEEVDASNGRYFVDRDCVRGIIHSRKRSVAMMQFLITTAKRDAPFMPTVTAVEIDWGAVEGYASEASIQCDLLRLRTDAQRPLVV